jgi:membrane protein implicated in regulation of membrane protease activity
MTTPRPQRFLAAALCILATLISALPAGAKAQAAKTQPAPLDLKSYAAQLGRVAEQIPRLRRDPAAIARFRQSLPAAWKVRAEGRDFEVSTEWLSAALAKIRKHPADAAAQWRAIHERLGFLQGQAEALESEANAPPTATRARPELEAIFRRSEFRGLEGPSALEMWWRKVTKWFGSLIAGLLGRLHLQAKMGNSVAYVLIVVALVLLGVGLWRNLAGRTRQLEMRIERPETVFDWRISVRDALAAAEQGRYREAIRGAYWAAVGRLEEMGAFPRDRSQTARELLRRLDSRPEQKALFRELATRFELVWYGYRAPSAADWESTKTQLERMGCLGVSTAGTGNS